jgi:hypothetical protein
MKTFQISMVVSYEYFIEANSFEEAQTKIIKENPNPESEELVEWVFIDQHDGNNWQIEPI